MFLDEIEILPVIAKTKSFSQAAKLLYLSRPALSNKIESIESMYGVKLYNRTSQGVTLTEAGYIITEYAKQIIKTKKQMDQELASLNESFIPSLTIGASYADGTYLLPKLIKGFRDKNPDSKIHMDVGYEPELIDKMYNSQINFSIIKGPCLNNDFYCHLLGYKRLVFLAPNLPPWNELRQPVEIKNLYPLPMIIYEWESARHLIGDQHFRKQHGDSLSNYNVVARLDTYDAMLQGIQCGLGFGLVPEVIAEKYRNNPNIITLAVKTSPVYYQVNLVYYKMAELSTEAQAFIEYIQDQSPRDYFEDISNYSVYK